MEYVHAVTERTFIEAKKAGPSPSHDLPAGFSEQFTYGTYVQRSSDIKAHPARFVVEVKMRSRGRRS